MTDWMTDKTQTNKTNNNNNIVLTALMSDGMKEWTDELAINMKTVLVSDRRLSDLINELINWMG